MLIKKLLKVNGNANKCERRGCDFTKITQEKGVQKWV